MSKTVHYDVLVIGSGPAGQKAAIQGAKAGKRVAIVEREQGVGGNCVHRGTIPSKTLRETALQLARLKQSAAALDCQLRGGVEIASMMGQLDHVVSAHVRYIDDQLSRNGVDRYHGRASFLSANVLQLMAIDGSTQTFTADIVVIATGSRPRCPENIPVDHEHILDSDSILSMIYLPRSLTVLGGGVIASEYASMFALLGVAVTMIDQSDRPVRFLDPELTDQFVGAFERHGGSYLGQQKIVEVTWDGLAKVVTRLESGQVVKSDKMLVALGRMANLEDLHIEAAGLQATQRGLLSVDEYCRTAVPHIYAVGDVIGPPALASTAMEQGRRAVCHALGLGLAVAPGTIPIAIYTIPEMASVGISEADAVSLNHGAVVGRAKFNEVARGQIAGITDGLLKMVADPNGQRLLGVHIVGEGAAELIHIAQMALLNHADVDSFVENIFNFPTLAEAYRIAALDITRKRKKCIDQNRIWQEGSVSASVTSGEMLATG